MWPFRRKQRRPKYGHFALRVRTIDASDRFMIYVPDSKEWLWAVVSPDGFSVRMRVEKDRIETLLPRAGYPLISRGWFDF
ncbi:MAG: hypothetical protein E6Q97_12485 [Desulfurellales bacterium]|nr:MAG: hypothetical protein E6Q97_12485 [Desulfurellales bacterium]